MNDTPYFLERLRLEEGASTSQVRRAYAQELKQIDPEVDPDKFQYLRHCYELALDWIMRGGAAPAMADLAAAPGGDDPADKVFTELLGECARLLAAEDYNSEHWDAMVRDFLARPDLVELMLRERLEARLAHWFQEGWQPGKDLLLAGVAKAFGWHDNRRRLSLYGEAGMLIDAALEEYSHFRHQATPTLNTQWAAIRHMREGVGKDRGRIRRTLGYFRTLRSKYPAWLYMAASPASIREWAAIDAKAPEQLQREYKAGVGTQVVQALIFVLVTTFIAARIFAPKPPARPQRDRADYYVSQAGQFMPNREWINDILDRIQYEPVAGARHGKQAGVFSVTLTELGNVESVDVAQSSGDPAFDQAAMKSIRESPGFPSDIARQFTLTLHPR